MLIAPCSTVAAFPLDEARPREERVLRVNGRDRDYNDQLFWAGLATLPSLPATSVPIGLNGQGLPLGVQVIAGAWEDRTALAAAAIEALRPATWPPGFA
ncbi:Asp-tRNA(Asn)/Glu-tRNA(Gln) amidotransferase A subunit family amidase [Roseococcus suduntuyensis]|uniref:Asp-tRNA(Asn)/Glu-tRNA(Gln) amidotransferase A subunit family amidase n=1 Tax=Roseococcus suduntuyensis TaxID=455361 RepID=A0A840AFI9_9PROT|nr:Asp-tRNA(Asn)/Glu-tRNA(Gln) amidotransferase A subunit family amidase [Roseococcus suduntuyensis]